VEREIRQSTVVFDERLAELGLRDLRRPDVGFLKGPVWRLVAWDLTANKVSLGCLSIAWFTLLP
jgi:hypothetical protein